MANEGVTSHHLLPDQGGAKPRPTRPGLTRKAWVVRPVGTTACNILLLYIMNILRRGTIAALRKNAALSRFSLSKAYESLA